MRLETLLPLGKVDPGLRAPQTGLALETVAADARLLEELGYDGVVIEETKQDPFVVMALAAQATTRLKVGTAIAMAFPRSPTITALSAWTLQRLARGRCTLGLGPQVRAHIERRYGMAWSAPGPWMREYVAAVRAVWDRWQNNAPLDFKGAHYALSLMPPLFDPGPNRTPANPHPSGGRQFLHVPGRRRNRRRAAPASDLLRRLRRQCHDPAGARGRQQSRPVARAFQDLPQASRGDGCQRGGARPARGRWARGSPSISPPLPIAAVAYHGLGELARTLSALARAEDWESMPAHISNEVLGLYTVIATHDEIAAKLRQRFGDVVTHCEFSIAVKSAADRERLARIVADMHADGHEGVQRRLCGEGDG